MIAVRASDIGLRPRTVSLGTTSILSFPGEQPAVAQCAGIGGQPHAKAALDQLDAERFGGKQMAAGAAGGQQNERCSWSMAFK